MKKLVPIFLLLLLLTQLAGFYVYFGFRLYAIHEESRTAIQSLPDHKLHCLRLMYEEFQAFGEDGYYEFEWKDRMYDVARVEISGDEVIVFALPDEAEDDLLAFLSAVVNNASQDRQPTPVSFLSFFSLSFLSADIVFLSNVSAELVKHDTRVLTTYKSPVLDFAGRPPLT